MTDPERERVLAALAAAQKAGNQDAVDRRTEQLKFCPHPVRG